MNAKDIIVYGLIAVSLFTSAIVSVKIDEITETKKELQQIGLKEIEYRVFSIEHGKAKIKLIAKTTSGESYIFELKGEKENVK